MSTVENIRIKDMLLPGEIEILFDEPEEDQEEQNTASSVSRMLTSPDMENVMEIEWAIKNFIPYGYVTLLVGDPKAGKTWLSLRGACDLSKGGPIFDGFTVAEAVSVLYLMGDTGKPLVDYRIKKAGWPFEKKLLKFGYLEEISRQGGEINLSASNWTLLEDLIKSIAARVVFIDTLTSFHVSNENDNQEMGRIITGLKRLAAKYGLAIVVLHHSRKKKRDELGLAMTQHDSVGAGVLNRLSGNIIGVEKKVGEDGEEKYLVRSLASWFKSFKPFSFTLRDEIKIGVGETVKMIFEETEMEKGAKEEITRTIRICYGAEEWFTRQEIMKRTGLSDKTVGSILNELAKTGVLQSEGTTRDKKFSLPISPDIREVKALFQ